MWVGAAIATIGALAAAWPALAPRSAAGLRLIGAALSLVGVAGVVVLVRNVTRGTVLLAVVGGVLLIRDALIELPWVAGVALLSGAAMVLRIERTATAVARWQRIVGALGFALQVAVGLFPFSASALLAPPIGVIALGVIWAGALGLVVSLWPRRAWIPVVPLGSIAAWAALLSLGDLLWEWGA